MMTHSALSMRSCGMSSGISMISFITVPLFSSRSASFLSSWENSAGAIIAMAIRQELILLIKFHLAEIYWAKLMIGCSWFERNLQFVWADCAPVSVSRDS